MSLILSMNMTTTIEVKRSCGTPSQVVIGDCLGRLGEFLPDRRVIVVTDSNVHRCYRKTIEQFDHILIGLGETNKNLLTLEKIYRELIGMDADRECFILGFGGGIVTDIAGFAASTYMRGVRFGFVASSLLAQVDASVGGKNGVNVDGFKNMAGTFNQPDFVLCDTGVLATLPDREFRAGMAEIVKTGIIADPELFETIEGHTLDELRSDRDLLQRVIAAAVRVKARIVEADEHESGERKKLNLGHTFAHAIEKCSREHIHGEAVAIGTVFIADMAVRMGLLRSDEAERIRLVFERLELPVTSPVDTRRLLKALRSDKKRSNDTVSIILPERIGRCIIRPMTFAELEALAH